MPTTDGDGTGPGTPAGTDGTAVTDLPGIAARVEPGDTVALGGKTLHRAPMAVVRELVRRGVDGLVPIGLANSMDVDLLAGTGGAAAAHYGYVGFEAFGLAPNFRAAVEAGELDAREGTCYTVATALRAAAQGVPSLPIAGLGDSDLLEVGGDYLTETDDPFTGETVRAVRRVRPDVGVIHATEADPAGNARYAGADLTENLVATAADRTLVTAERIVDPDAFADDPAATDVPGVLVDAVAEVPRGAHPCSCPGAYDYDAAHLREYLDRSRAGDLDGYLDAFLGDSEADYRERAIDDPAALAGEDGPGGPRDDHAATAAAPDHDPAPAADRTVAEVMAAAIARRLADVDVAFQGFASPLPTAALRAARERDGVTHLSASGAMNGAPAATPLSTEDAGLLEGAAAHFTSPEAFDLAARGGIDVMFVGGAQVDRRGRLNNTVAGSWAEPAVKFGGGGGSGSLLPLVEEAWAWRTEHRARSLPPDVDFVTAAGNLTYLVTPLCEFERRGGELRVVSLHPGVDRATIRERTGWDVRFDDPGRTATPDDGELALLDRVDPDRVRRSGFADLDPIG